MYDDGYSYTLEQQGDWRVRLVADEHAEAPDGDGQGFVLGFGSYLADVQHADFGEAGEADDMARVVAAFGMRFGHDLDLLERHLRIWHDVVDFDQLDTRDGTMLFIVTRSQYAKWQMISLDEASEVPAGLTRGTVAEWRAWLEGDVYYYVVERLVDLSMTDYDDLESWEQVESCGGYYGAVWAEQAAREALADSMLSEAVAVSA